jgi:superfamily II DNA/RNA helicase
MVATDIAARGIHIDGIDLVVHADPPAEHKAYVHRSGRTARGGADGVVVTLQTRSQARDVTAMMRKADITPHPAVAVDGNSPVLAEIAGPRAARVEVSGKVSELVQADERLAANDRPGGGKPWEGRSGRNGGGRGTGAAGGRRPRSRDRGPRDESVSRDSGPRTGQAPRNDRPARGERPERTERAPQGRNARGSNDWYPRSGGSGSGGPSRSGPGGDRQFRDARPVRDERQGNRPVRDDRPARDEHSGREDRPTGRSARAERPQAGGNFGGSSRRSGYSGGRGSAGNRRDSGQGRHF